MTTVKVNISIQIDEEDDCDTGLTISEWNALTDAERSEIVRDMWNEVASRDNGGISVITDGAVKF